MNDMRLGSLLLLLFVALGTEAQQTFRAVLLGLDAEGCVITTPLTIPTLEWVEGRVESFTTLAYIASDGNDHVFGLTGPGVTIVRIQPDGTRTPFYQDLSALAGSFAVGRDGRVFVPVRIGGSFFMAVISPAGALEVTYPLPIFGLPSFTAVAYDGCTVSFGPSTGTAIGRFNACTGTPLPDIAVAGPLYDVEPLTNGQILVAEGVNANLYDANGTFIRTVVNLAAYGFDPRDGNDRIGQIAVDSNMGEVWFTTYGCDVRAILVRAQFNSGAEMWRTDVVAPMRS